MANNFYVATVLTGGGTGALDAIDGADLNDLDAAFVQTFGTVYFYTLDDDSNATENSPNIIKPDSNAGTKRWVIQNVSSGGYIRLHDSKSSGADGGTFTQDVWQKRTLTEDIDTENNVSVSSSVITLDAGTYDCHIRCSAYDIKRHKSRLRNTADNDTAVIGSTEYCSDVDNVANHSVIQGRFTITAQKTFEVQHQCTQTKASNGWGLGTGTGEAEIYCVAEFWKRG